MSNNNYYNKTWNEPDNHGTIFFKHVDFSAPEYKYQEKVFREYIRTLDKSKIHSVLELGAGTGRMTKIMLDELPNIEKYDAVDIKMVFNPSPDSKLTWCKMDIMSKQFDIVFDHMDYDLILASEVFMHIKPQDIEQVIQKLSKIGKQIINIDWQFEECPSEWCFVHPYDYIYSKYGAKRIKMIPMESIKQVLFHYRLYD